MIVYRNGDIVEAFKNNEIDILVHGVNCQGKMNSGIAKQIRAEFPKVFEDYSFYAVTRECSNCSDCCVCGSENKKSSTLLGLTQNVRVGQFKFIVNAFTQDRYGYDGKMFCSYDAIRDCMNRIVGESTENDKIGMPKIGAGLGGGDWNVIEAIINSAFGDRDVYVYTLD